MGEAHTKKLSIRVPIGVAPKLRRQIKRAYSSVMEEIGDAEAEYVCRRFHATVLSVERQRSKWRQELGCLSRALFSICFDDRQLDDESRARSRPCALAALFYLCNPYDIIPDYTPGTGYVDDALVVNFALSDIRRRAPYVYSRLLEIVEEGTR